MVEFSIRFRYKISNTRRSFSLYSSQFHSQTHLFLEERKVHFFFPFLCRYSEFQRWVFKYHYFFIKNIQQNARIFAIDEPSETHDDEMI